MSFTGFGGFDGHGGKSSAQQQQHPDFASFNAYSGSSAVGSGGGGGFNAYSAGGAGGVGGSSGVGGVGFGSGGFQSAMASVNQPFLSAFGASLDGVSSGAVVSAVPAAVAPRPPETEPLQVLTWYLESKSNVNCAVRTPMLEFEIHQYTFVPFRSPLTSALPSTFAPPHNSSQARPVFSVVSLSMVNGAPRPANHAGATQADLDLRLTVVRHVLKEMIRIQGWDALMVYRQNNELAPTLNAIYQHAIPQELNKLQPQVRRVAVEPKHNSLQIVLSRP